MFHKIVQDGRTGDYLIALHASLLIPITSIYGLSTLSFTRGGTGKIKDGVATSLNDAVRKMLLYYYDVHP